MSLLIIYPIPAPVGVVALRSPVVGNLKRLDTNAVTRDTVGGETKSVKDASWPNIETRQFEFEHLKQDPSIDGIRTGFAASAGLTTRIVDYKNGVWEGYITSDINEIIALRDECSFGFSFDFMGEYIGQSEGVLNVDEVQVLNDNEDDIFSV